MTGAGGERVGSADEDRALSPVVGKALEAGIVVLFVALLTTTLYGGVVPNYRTAVGSEVGDRALVAAAERVERAVPSTATHVDRRVAVALPPTVRGAAYRVRTENESLVLDHPRPGVGGRVRLSLPAHVGNVTGTWSSGSRSWVVVRGGENATVRLADGTPTPTGTATTTGATTSTGAGTPTETATTTKRGTDTPASAGERTGSAAPVSSGPPGTGEAADA
jgi:hypothetical protein